MVRAAHQSRPRRTRGSVDGSPERTGSHAPVDEEIDQLVGRVDRIALRTEVEDDDEEEDNEEDEDDGPLYIQAFVHGSARGNGQPGATGAYAIVFPDYPELSVAIALDEGERATNQRTSYQGALEAIQIVNRNFGRPVHIQIITNNEVMNKSMNLWREDWDSNDGRLTNTNRRARNRDLIQQITENTRPGQLIAWLHYDRDFNGQEEKMRALQHHEEACRLAKRAAPARP